MCPREVVIYLNSYSIRMKQELFELKNLAFGVVCELRLGLLFLSLWLRLASQSFPRVWGWAFSNPIFFFFFFFFHLITTFCLLFMRYCRELKGDLFGCIPTFFASSIDHLTVGLNLAAVLIESMSCMNASWRSFELSEAMWHMTACDFMHDIFQRKSRQKIVIYKFYLVFLYFIKKEFYLLSVGFGRREFLQY